VVDVIAEVRLWDRTVGALAETGGRIYFEYDPAFVRDGFDISPFHLPRRPGVFEFAPLRRSDAFEGLAGVFADSLPDRFGNAVIARYFTQKGQPEAALSPVQKLLYLGARPMGALEYAPAIDAGDGNVDATLPLEIAELVGQARRVIEGDLDAVTPELMTSASSAGGARAKAIISWDRAHNEVRLGHAPVAPGFEPWIIKFDGAGDLEHAGPAAPGPFGRIEYAYAQMAVKAGLDMAETHLLEEGGRAHFMTRRFDRVDGVKVHMHSLCGLRHLDFNVPGVADYDDYLRTVLELDLGYPSLRQAYRRMVFNVVARNQDDHTKNLGFLMGADGAWRLTPAFDVTYANGQGWTRTHQMRIDGKTDGVTHADLETVGARFSIRDAADVIGEVVSAVADWARFASAAGVPPEWETKIAGDHQFS